jgi:ubiquinone/menaquinone biosynthesis C-methylase UbiE
MEKKLLQYWDEQARKYGECPWATGWGGHLRKIEIGEVRKRLPKNGSILDVGCGNGYVLEKLVSSGQNLMGIDLSRDMTKIAKKRLGRTCEIILASAVNLPFRDGTFDFVYTIRTLIFLSKEKKEKGIMETIRVLRPNRLLVLAECCEEGINNLNPLRQSFRVSPSLSTHGLFFKAKTIESTLTRNNVKIVKKTYFPIVSILEKVLYPKVENLRAATKFFSFLYLPFYQLDKIFFRFFPVLGFDIIYVGRKS